MTLVKILFIAFACLVSSITGQEKTLCDSNESWSWTPWFNSHSPSVKGEYELHAAIRSQHPTTVCSQPYAVSAVNQAGVHMNETLDMIVLRSYDVFCLNSYDPKYQQKLCDDYSVRYCCPNTLTSSSTIENDPSRDNQWKNVQQKCGRVPHSTGLFMGLFNTIFSKIINGVEARPNSWPWLVSIGVQYRSAAGVWQNRTHVCGGTLIEPSHVLTAAHCLEQKIDDRFVPLTSTNPTLESFFILRIGIHDIRSTRSQEIYRARRIFSHENFISSTFENDVAVIRLDRPIRITDDVAPICLPSGNVPTGKQATVAGWGTVSETARAHSNVLRQANVNVLSAANCRVYKDVHYDNSKQLCAAALDWSKDTW